MFKSYLETFQKYRFLLANLITRDLKLKYRRSVLGLLWSLLNPILMMLIMNAVFSRLVGSSEINNYPMYLIAGQTLFIFFNEATSSALESVVGSSALMKKIYVPKYVFPLEKVLYAFVNLLFSMVAVILVLMFNPVPLSSAMFFVPVPLILMLLFAVGFGLVLSALYAFFRDIKHLYSVIILAWMYLTPIIYPVSFVEGAFLIETLVKVNPLTWYITYFRDVLLYGRIPGAALNLVCAAYSLGMLGLGLFVFKKAQDKFILHI
ncbi:MAG: ABC transporter permease [Oscillospiraceae bacterium]|nr:ABC transporter permease [Oscillospiraceae bacterium]